MTAPTRRHVIAGSLAALGAAGAPAIAADDQDRAEWLGLWQDFLAVEALQMDDDSEIDEDTRGELSWEAQQAISDKPATSMVGVAVKLALYLRADVLVRIGDTLDNAYAQHDCVIAAYCDACRMAGFSEDVWEKGLPA